MKITRNGQEFELTESELIEAYYEERDKIDKATILTQMEYREEDGISTKPLDEWHLNEAAAILREALDNNEDRIIYRFADTAIEEVS